MVRGGGGLFGEEGGGTYVQNRGHDPGRVGPLLSGSSLACSQTLRYGERTARGTAGGRAGMNVVAAMAVAARVVRRRKRGGRRIVGGGGRGRAECGGMRARGRHGGSLRGRDGDDG